METKIDSADVFSNTPVPPVEFDESRVLITRLEFWATVLRGTVADGAAGELYGGVAADLLKDFTAAESWISSLKPPVAYKNDLNSVAKLLSRPPGDGWLQASKILSELANRLRVSCLVFKPKRTCRRRRNYAKDCPACGSNQTRVYCSTASRVKVYCACGVCGERWSQLVTTIQ